MGLDKLNRQETAVRLVEKVLPGPLPEGTEGLVGRGWRGGHHRPGERLKILGEVSHQQEQDGDGVVSLAWQEGRDRASRGRGSLTPSRPGSGTYSQMPPVRSSPESGAASHPPLVATYILVSPR